MKRFYFHYIALVVGLAWGPLAAACTSSSQPTKIGVQPSWRSTGEQPSGPQADSPAPLEFAPASPAVPFYNDPPREQAPSSPLADAVARAIEDYCAAAGIEPPRPDGRLYKAAAEMARVIPEDEPLAYPIIEFALQRHGIIEPSPHLLPVAGTLDDPEPMLRELAARLPPILSSESVTRFGVGTAPGDGPGRDLLVLLLQSSHIETEPIPREVTGSDTVVIEGRALGDYRDPSVFVTGDDGFVVRQELERRGSRGFRAALSCRGRRGRQQIEITAVNDAGSTVLANFPVWCNARAPTRITVKPSVDHTAPVATVAEAEARMLALVNRDREALGLHELERSAELSEVARAHSRDMRDNGFVAHVSPATGTAEDRVRAAKIRTALVLENVARAYGVAEAQAGLMNSPGHRANLLSKKATHIGIGIAFEESMSEGRVMFITQLFTRVPPPIDAARARQRLLARIAAERGQLIHDPELSTVAQAYVEEMVIPGRTEATAAKWRDRHFDALRPRFARVGTAVVTVVDIASLDIAQAFREPWITHYGVGVAQGPHEEFGEGAIFIVLLLAQTR